MFLCTKTLKHVNINLYEGKKNNNKTSSKTSPETCHLGVLSVIRQQNATKKKKHGKHPIWENVISL